MKKLFNGVLNSVIFVLGLWMIVHFQKTINMQSLLMMLVGLGLLLTLLYRYNKRYL